jgi:glycosyltransferase involved in cell wall biosynthesis
MNGNVVAAPKVSIGMPVYNGEPFIALALDSLRNQTYSNYELIIVDNVSTDGTEEICRRYAAVDHRIKYFRNDAHVHPMDNFNRSLHQAVAPYFMWAAHDDIREPQFIASLVDALESNPKAVVAFSGFDNIDENGRSVRAFHENWGEIVAGSKFRQFWAMTLFDDGRTQKANAAIYGLMRRDVLRACGGMQAVPKVVFCGEDVLVLLRLLSVGEFHYINTVLFHYRVRAHAVRVQGQSVTQYVMNRIFRQTAQHRGSLLLFLIRNRAYHREMRRIVIENAPVGVHEKLLLWLLILAKELWVPVTTIPRAAYHELRPKRLRKSRVH